MKNINLILIALIGLIFMTGFAFAQNQQGVHEPGTGINNPELKAENQGTGQGIEDGEYTNNKGQKMKVSRENNNQCRLEVENISATCLNNLTREMIQNKSQLKMKLSNGRNAEIKIMPSTASETALARLRLRNCNENCTIELKEIGKGNKTRAAYEIKTQKQSKVFGLFKANMNVQAQVDAETGEIIRSQKPWWAFLASESDETEE